jgi:hypothetical protein
MHYYVNTVFLSKLVKERKFKQWWPYDNFQPISTADDIGNYFANNNNKNNPTSYLPIWTYISQLYKVKDCVVIELRSENELLMGKFCKWRLVNCNYNITAPVDISNSAVSVMFKSHTTNEMIVWYWEDISINTLHLSIVVVVNVF